MKIVTTKALSDDQKQRVFEIWNAEYPVKLQMPAMADFDEFINTLADTKHYLLSDNYCIAGWAAVFSIERVRCFFIMLASIVHGKGYGTLLLNQLKNDEKQLFAWAIDHDNDLKLNGEPYRSPIGFYQKNGFKINKELRLETVQLSAVNILWNREE